MLLVYCGGKIPCSYICSSLFMLYPLIGQTTDRDLFLWLWFKIFLENLQRRQWRLVVHLEVSMQRLACVLQRICDTLVHGLWLKPVWLRASKEKAVSWQCDFFFACSSHSRIWWTCCVMLCHPTGPWLHGYAFVRLCQGWRWNSSEQKSFNSHR